MMDENIDNLKDILFHLEIEGTYFYKDEVNKDDYFIAYRLIVIASDQDNEDCEGEIGFHLKSEMSDDYLIFTYVGENSEPHRIIGLPEIEYFEFENGVGTLLEKINIVDAVEFLKNMKTINFKELKSENLHNKKNFKHVKSNKIEEADSNKTIVEKTYHENGQIKSELEVINDIAHGLYKEYHDNGQLRVTIRFEKGHQVDGVVDSFDENGRLIRKVEIINGNKNGPFKEFYTSGTIKKEGEYKDDEIIGKPIEYYEDGYIKVET
jgi:antitoxin component YwqK of YwqJK toxin-antitoxin module